MSSSLRKLIAHVRSSLKGTLRTIDNAVIPHRHILYVEGDVEFATNTFSTIFGPEKVHVLPTAAPDTSRATLCIKATRDGIEDVVRTVPHEVALVAIASFSEEKADLADRRLHHIL